jgi:two-component system response regulator VicR
MKIMLADDDQGMQTLVSHIVREANHEFVCASDGEQALAVFERERPDLLILDVMMPKLNGFEVAARLRERRAATPIIMLTAKGDIVDKSIGFTAGADDYLVKPFIAQELQLRIEALLRRGQKGRSRGYLPDILTFDGLEIDAKRRKVVAHGRQVELTPKEFHLLYMLACNPGVVFTRDQLIEDIWGPEYLGEVTGITVLIHRIREKTEADPHEPRFIQTVWHVGYRFGD